MIDTRSGLTEQIMLLHERVLFHNMLCCTFVLKKNLTYHVFCYPPGSIGAFKDDSHSEPEGYDGWYNNLAHPDWGGAGKNDFKKNKT